MTNYEQFLQLKQIRGTLFRYEFSWNGNLKDSLRFFYDTGNCTHEKYLDPDAWKALEGPLQATQYTCGQITASLSTDIGLAVRQTMLKLIDIRLRELAEKCQAEATSILETLK